MSRMLWHCLPAYRGWAEVDGETVGKEGRELCLESGLRGSWIWGFLNVEEDDE